MWEHLFRIWWCLLVLLLLLEAVDAFASSSARRGGGSTTSTRIIWLAAATTTTPTEQQQQHTVPWLIVGGGPTGVHIAARLCRTAATTTAADDTTTLIVVDDGPRLLHGWTQRTAATGMTYLRSSASQHLDVPDDDSLRRFAASVVVVRGRQKDASLAADYQRPRLDVFQAHCEHVIAKYGLADRHVQGRVVDIYVDDDDDSVVRVRVQQPEDGSIVELSANHVVLALGNAAPVIPDWVTTEDVRGRVRHILDYENHDDDDHSSTNDQHHSDPRPRSVAIVGGGMSAAHLALRLTRSGSSSSSSATTIHMICRHALREQQFDTHQDWMMDAAAAVRSAAGGGQGVPRRQRQFASLRRDAVTARRRTIQRERRGGTISAAVHRGKDGLRYAIEQGRVHWHEGAVQSVSFDDDGDDMLRLYLSTGDEVVVEEVILATGFSRDPPGKHLVHTLAARYGAKLSPCGYPIPDQQLRWHDRIFVAGALAELEIGPSARNIAGARIAAERIAAAAVAEGTSTVSLAVATSNQSPAASH